MTKGTKRIVANELRSGERVEGTFLVRRKHRGVGRTGKPWLQLMLGDATGTIDARVWDDAERIDREIRENDVVDVEGIGVYYMDRVQLKVLRIRRAEGTLAAQLLPASAKPVDERAAELRAELEILANPWLRRLAAAYLDDERWLAAFLRAPAARSIHHAYVGGLSDHTLSMMRLARRIGEHYRGLGVPVDVDLLVMGAFLHDSGKIEEISAEGGFAYTDAGRLVGHIALGMAELDRRIATIPEFPAELQMHLRHLILSHHGEYEHGSPRRPKTLEALILHFVDNMDARVEIFHKAIEGATGEGSWTGFEPSVGRYIWRGRDDEER